MQPQAYMLSCVDILKHALHPCTWSLLDIQMQTCICTRPHATTGICTVLTQLNMLLYSCTCSLLDIQMQTCICTRPHATTGIYVRLCWHTYTCFYIHAHVLACVSCYTCALLHSLKNADIHMPSQAPQEHAPAHVCTPAPACMHILKHTNTYLACISVRKLNSIHALTHTFRWSLRNPCLHILTIASFASSCGIECSTLTYLHTWICFRLLSCTQGPVAIQAHTDTCRVYIRDFKCNP